MWVKYFVNGKVQTEYAVITYGKFDSKKLVWVIVSQSHLKSHTPCATCSSGTLKEHGPQSVVD
jgi:hypothetical protein